MASTNESVGLVLSEILESLKSLQKDNATLASAVDAINGRVNMLAGVKQIHDVANKSSTPPLAGTSSKPADDKEIRPSSGLGQVAEQYEKVTPSATPDPAAARPQNFTSSKIILTSYPGQSGVDPIVMHWGHKDPVQRGPVVVSRHLNTIRRRNGMFLMLIRIFVLFFGLFHFNDLP